MIRTVRSKWQGVVLVCAKCEKKLGGGFGPNGDRKLSSLLRGAVSGGKGRKAAAGIMPSKCLKVCPKRGVTVIDAARPDRWLVVPERTDMEEIVRLLSCGPDSYERPYDPAFVFGVAEQAVTSRS